MKWHQDLYVGESLQKKQRTRTVIRQTERGKSLPGLYLLTIPAREINQIEIIPTFFFQKQPFEQVDTLIVGMCFGMEEAKALLVQMTEDVYRKTGTADLRRYLLETYRPSDRKKRRVR